MVIFLGKNALTVSLIGTLLDAVVSSSCNVDVGGMSPAPGDCMPELSDIISIESSAGAATAGC